MKTLGRCIQEAAEEGRAIGHFNISNLEGFHAVVDGARAVGVPVIIGVSEGERDFVGVREVVSLVRGYREATGQEVFLNADHTYSFKRVKEAIDVGYDSVIFDGTELPYAENVALSKQSVDYAASVNPDVLVECEIGFIGKSSKLLDKVPDGVGMLTTVEEAADFVRQTGVHMLAPAVGNVHGMVKGGEPALNIERIAAIRAAADIPLVLHGASGNSDADIRAAIKAGIAIVHINTELRVAYKKGLEEYLKEHPDEIAPYKYLKGGRTAMQKVVEEKLKLFTISI